MENSKARLNLILSMAVFGTVGIFVKYVAMPSCVIAMARGLIGALFIFLFLKASHKPVDREAIKKNLFIMILSGTSMAFNWICLFESYNYTTVAIATLCYYMQPVFLIISSPLLFKERISAKKLICVLTALLGMVFVSGLVGGENARVSAKGIILGIMAALLYSVVVITSKKFKDIDSTNATMIQLLSAGTVMIPYCLLTVGPGELHITGFGLIMLLCVCLIHTGICYVVYFDAVYKLPTQTVAIFGYMDPIVSILLSALLLKEPFGWTTAIGAVLILGSTLVSEMNFNKGTNK